MGRQPALRERRRGGSGSRARSRASLVLVAIAALIGGRSALQAQEALQPGEAFVTKFSGTTTADTPAGPRTVIDLAGQVGVALDLRTPGFSADGRHWLNEPQLFSVTAGDVGQVFGVALDDANPPNIYLTATVGLRPSPQCR